AAVLNVICTWPAGQGVIRAELRRDQTRPATQAESRTGPGHKRTPSRRPNRGAASANRQSTKRECGSDPPEGCLCSVSSSTSCTGCGQDVSAQIMWSAQFVVADGTANSRVNRVEASGLQDCPHRTKGSLGKPAAIDAANPQQRGGAPSPVHQLLVNKIAASMSSGTQSIMSPQPGRVFSYVDSRSMGHVSLALLYRDMAAVFLVIYTLSTHYAWASARRLSLKQWAFKMRNMIRYMYGVNVPCLGPQAALEFERRASGRRPHHGTGDITGFVRENNLGWPVRQPPQLLEKQQANPPTAERASALLYALFPLRPGRHTANPWRLGCGKNRHLAVAELLRDFHLEVEIDGREESHHVAAGLVANTSNMPWPLAQASIYTGITCRAIRDMGTRSAEHDGRTPPRVWAEGLCERSPAVWPRCRRSGLPCYLGARPAARSTSGPAVPPVCGSPASRRLRHHRWRRVAPGGTSPIVTPRSTRGIVQVFWGLDKKLAQRKHFPRLLTG
uniref:H(+)-transporting two-sector ATPase n=1 Tax=Macrostomum lignano TaxID=282301 RepID=A0A1I8JR77_9PLAT